MVSASVLVLLWCSATVIDAQIKCNPVSIVVGDGWCKGKTVAYSGCFDATKPDSDPSSKAAFITLNQNTFKTLDSSATCLAGATSLCTTIGSTPRSWDCTDVNNECKADNLANNYGVGACTVDSQCTGFAQSTYDICCSSLKNWIMSLICQNADSSKVNAWAVPPTVCSNDQNCRQAGASSSRASMLITMVSGATSVLFLTMIASH